MGYSDTARNIASKYRVDPDLVDAVIQVESSYNPSAIRRESSGLTSYGLMQVTLPAAREVLGNLSANDLLIPETNIVAGTLYLKTQLNRYGNAADALAHYNSGTVRKNSQGQYINSQGSTNVNNYVDKVLSIYTSGSIPLSFGSIFNVSELGIDTENLFKAPYIFYVGAGFLFLIILLMKKIYG